MSLPYFPLYPRDFEADTSHLSMLEDGAYNRILRLMWMTPGCSIPAEEAWIMRRLRANTDAEVEAVRTVLAEFFKRENGRYISPRLSKEAMLAIDAHTRRVEAGRKGGRKPKALKNNKTSESNAKAKPKQPEPEPYIEDTNVSSLCVIAPEPPDLFEDFWSQYPHRGGAKKGKQAARKSWDRAVKAKTNPSQIIQGAMRYAADAQVVRGWAKDPATWLNQRCWEDDVEPEQRPSVGAGSGPSGGMVAAFAAVAARRTNH